MDSIYFGLIVIVCMICFFSNAYFTSWLARKKGYNSRQWGIFGFFFGFVALLAIGFAPIDEENQNTNFDQGKNIVGSDKIILETEVKIKKILENIDSDIKNEDLKINVLMNKNNLNTAYEIFNLNGKIEMNEYIKKLIGSNKINESA